MGLFSVIGDELVEFALTFFACAARLDVASSQFTDGTFDRVSQAAIRPVILIADMQADTMRRLAIGIDAATTAVDQIAILPVFAGDGQTCLLIRFIGHAGDLSCDVGCWFNTH